jgi:preprotein translocase subunit SecG
LPSREEFTARLRFSVGKRLSSGELMTVVLVVFHVIVALLLMLVVLLQQGKGADLAGAFGGGGSQTAFGARGATTVLHKATTVLFILFVVTSLSIAVIQSRPRSSVMTGAPAAPTAPAPAPAK